MVGDEGKTVGESRTFRFGYGTQKREPKGPRRPGIPGTWPVTYSWLFLNVWCVLILSSLKGYWAKWVPFFLSVNLLNFAGVRFIPWSWTRSRRPSSLGALTALVRSGMSRPAYAVRACVSVEKSDVPLSMRALVWIDVHFVNRKQKCSPVLRFFLSGSAN